MPRSLGLPWLRDPPPPRSRPKKGKSTQECHVESGQVFYEATLEAPAASRRLWIHDCNGGSQFRHTQEFGPPSLRSSALRSVLMNLRNITPEVLREVPTVIGEEIWENVLRCEYDSLYIWRLFAMVHPDYRSRNLQYHPQSIESPSLPLQSYITPIISESLQWITHLSICISSFTRLELVNLSRLVNLGALNITGRAEDADQDSMPAVGDSLVRSWSRAASADGAFARLRVLVLRDHDDITARSLGYLSSFPSLMFYSIHGCDIRDIRENQAVSLGWSYRLGRITFATFQTDLKRDGLLPVASRPLSVLFSHAGLLLHTQTLAEQGAEKAQDVKKVEALPELDFQVGPMAGADLLSSCASGQALVFQRLHLNRGSSLRSGKRDVSELGQPSGRAEPKKRKLRHSKHQGFESVLQDLGASSQTKTRTCIGLRRG